MKLVSRDHCNCPPVSSSWLRKVREGRVPDPGAGSKPPALTTVRVGLRAGTGQQRLRREPPHGLPPQERKMGRGWQDTAGTRSLSHVPPKTGGGRWRELRRVMTPGSQVPALAWPLTSYVTSFRKDDKQTSLWSPLL